MLLRIALLALVSSTWAITGNAGQAEEGAVAEARVVIYRAEESYRTKKMKYQVRLDTEAVGRLKYNRALVTTATPGEYRLQTTIEGSEPLVVNLQPGQTVYVHSKVRKLGGRILTEFTLVEEQVAVQQQPALEQVI
jgi:hypothetical protein